MRWLTLVLVVLLAGQLSGVTRFVSDDGCTDDCPDEASTTALAGSDSGDDEGHDGPSCPPSCPTCACTTRPPHVLPDVISALTLAPPPPSPAALAPGVRTVALPSPDPHEILHVPIAPLA